MNARPLVRRAAGAICGALLAAAAQADDERGVSLALTQEVTPAPTLAQTTQSMLWARRQALAFGVGVEQRSALELPAAGVPPGAPVLGQRLLVGLSIAATERTSIALQAPLWSEAREREWQAVEPARMALRSRDTLGEWRAGLQMKMQLREQTTLAIRPRKGGVGVTLRSQW